MKGDGTYQPPTIETMPANRIVELLGPVSCGSNGSGLQQTNPGNGLALHG